MDLSCLRGKPCTIIVAWLFRTSEGSRLIINGGNNMTKRTMLLWVLLMILATSLVGSLYAQRAAVADECKNCGAGVIPGVVATAQYNNYRTGWYPYEYQLWPDTVSPATFGKKWSVTLDGQVYGSPLY